MNLTTAEDVQNLRQLQRYSEIFLEFSYYSGFIIAGFNFNIFLLAAILYTQVNLHIAVHFNSFFLDFFRKNLKLFRKPREELL